jgi:hypothetical protein
MEWFEAQKEAERLLELTKVEETTVTVQRVPPFEGKLDDPAATEMATMQQEQPVRPEGVQVFV